LVPAPPNPDRAEDEPAEPSGLERLAGLDDGNVETILLHDEKLHPGLVAGADHVISILQPKRHRLLDDDMLSRACACYRVLRMHPAGRQDSHGVHVLARKKLVYIIVGINTEFGSERVGPRLQDVADGDQPCSVNVIATK
jgi:hypothetical protein